MDDKTLFELVRRGDENALVELVNRYHSPLYKFLCRFTGDIHLANDLVQETFTRLLIYQGAAPDQFKSWMYALARNLARDHFRSRHYRYEQAADFSDDTLGFDPLQFTIGENDDVTTALAALTADQREVIVLRFYHDLKLEEIAEITGAPVGTVKSRLFHALKRLKGFLAVTEIPYDRQ